MISYIFLILSHFVLSILSEDNLITCDSVIKLINIDYSVRLHSHEVQYGSGSGQQSVTAIKDETDVGSYWKIIQRHRAPECKRGTPIKCGQTIRLYHRSTEKNLHSHNFQSPLSHNFEVSAFGTKGSGDEGDDWKIQCDSKYWTRNSIVKFAHVATGGLLFVSGRTYNQPIQGQYEVSGAKSAQGSSWKAEAGIFIKGSEEENNVYNNGSGHDEL